MKFISIGLLCFAFIAGCNNPPGEQQPNADTVENYEGNNAGTENYTSADNVSLSKTYTNSKYHINLKLPANWVAVEQISYSGSVIAIYPEEVLSMINTDLLYPLF